MAGVMAALAARRDALRVIIIESSNVLGGQGTAGGVAGFCGDTTRVNDEFADLVGRLTAAGKIAPYRPDDDRRAYDLEWCAFFLQEMVVERGVEVLLHAQVVETGCRDGRVQTLQVATLAGLITLPVKFVIDASGSCIVPLLAGFPVVHEGANQQLPMSLYFTLWDTGKTVTPLLPAGCPRWSHEDEIPMTSLHSFPTGKVEVKMKVVGFDAADPRSRSAAEIFARRQMHGLIHFLQTKGYQGQRLDRHVLAGVSRSIGVREERRIVGEHMLTEGEARRGVIFEDGVAVNTYHIDYHWPDRVERAGTGITDMLAPHHLPLRMMIPRGAINILVPGRGASGDQMAMSAFRVMAVVAQMGFAAGHAARLCLAGNTDPRRLDLRRLKNEIEAGGQCLDLSQYGGYLRSKILVDESPVLLQPNAGLVTAAALKQMRNGTFLAAWATAAEGVVEVRVIMRREQQWRVPCRIDTHGPGAVRQLQFVSAGAGEVELLVLQELAGGTMIWRGHHLSDEGMPENSGPVERIEPPCPSRILSDGRSIKVACHPKGLVLTKAVGAAEWLPTGELPDGAQAAVNTVGLLDHGEVVCLGGTSDGHGINVYVSRDLGSSWACGHLWADRQMLAPGAYALTATGTGVAVWAPPANGAMAFWHGAINRICPDAHQSERHV